MASEFLLPDIGEGLTEATIIEWLVAVGDEVGLDEPLVEVETDKALVVIPSPLAGTVLHHGAMPGEALEVGALLAVVGDAGETWAASESDSNGMGAAEGPADVKPIVGSLDKAVEVVGVQALPAVRQLAAELGVDIGTLVGTGPGGRIVESDVVAASDGRAVERRPISPTRRTIAANVTKAWQQIPHVTTFGSADATGLIAARQRRGEPPFEALLIEALIPVLERHPAFNSRWREDHVLVPSYVDVGFAVDTGDGLMIAVIRDAHAKSGDALASEVRVLAESVRHRTAPPELMRGQTFTISNIGAVGGGFGTPIIPEGTTAIASFGRAEPRPAVVQGELAIVTELPVSLSYDHRVVDGAAGRAFMADMIDAIERIDGAQT